MADKKLNESKIVKDMDYVLVTLADGSVGQIAKSDLASVVAGNLKFNTEVQRLNSSFENKDANEIHTNGFFINSNKMSNVPTAYGTLISFQVPAMTVQFYVEANTGSAFFVRNYSAEKWSPWMKLTSTTN